MKPALEHLPKEKDESFVVKSFDYGFYPTPWHYHPEYEIALVTESTGERFIGNHVSAFGPGNLAFLGPNIPHTYRNDAEYYKGNPALRAKAIVIHFTEESLGADFLALPEAKSLQTVFDRSAQGCDVEGETHRYISNKLYDIVLLQGLKRWLCLVDMLLELAASKTLKSILQTPQTGYNEKESKRLCAVLDWITANFENEVRLSEAARIAGMNENAFSRFFSLRTRKTFSAYVQQLRLQKAAGLLSEGCLAITEICFECGYNNISNFNRQFLNRYGTNPMQYRKAFLKKY